MQVLLIDDDQAQVAALTTELHAARDAVRAWAEQLVPRRSIQPTASSLCSRLGYRRGIYALRY